MTIKEQILKEFEKKLTVYKQDVGTERESYQLYFKGTKEEAIQFLSNAIDRVANEFIIVPLASPQLACSKKMLDKIKKLTK